MDNGILALIVIVAAAVLAGYAVWRSRTARRAPATGTDRAHAEVARPRVEPGEVAQPGIEPSVAAGPGSVASAPMNRPPGAPHPAPAPPQPTSANPPFAPPAPPAPPQPGPSASEAEPGTGEIPRVSAPDAMAGAALPEPVRFSAYYPKEAAPLVWLPLRAYIFRRVAAGAVEADALKVLGERLAEYRPVTGDSSVPLAEGALITATPELPGFQFNPPSASVAFFEDWHAFDFRLRAATATVEQAANGRIVFTAEGVIVADLPLSVFVTTSVSASTAAPASAATDAYDAIFCSYSHKDAAIVERLERAYKALGLDYLRDVTTLRSGEEWNPRLLTLIDEADIFQLFWSSAAAESRYVRQEWEHALSLGRGGAFVRPVYWEQPMPKVPDQLGQLHFHFDPALVDSR